MCSGTATPDCPGTSVFPELLSSRTLLRPRTGALRRCKASVFSGGVLLKPHYIHIPRGLEVVVDLAVFNQGRHSAVVAPFMNLGVAIGKRETPSPAMIKRRQIIETQFSGVGGVVAAHIGREIA